MLLSSKDLNQKSSFVAVSVDMLTFGLANFDLMISVLSLGFNYHSGTTKIKYHFNKLMSRIKLTPRAFNEKIQFNS
ncbi:hypothetical protein BpHYR1_045628 [Brachionus plicatilis]|uniref:Uncharacterized protein n=1 Tax=Brachionus plicatilis TaxID=10195 RepID=A0A3M7QTE2_BRAPC|nr:hypothetical protein BpHYR1_045628 [Brachionus plicatilis]